MAKIHLWPEDIQEDDGMVSAGFVLEDLRGECQHYWYRLPGEYRPALTQNCDPYMVAAIHTAMRDSADLVVHGEVSPSLLGNLDEFQTVWSSWLPAHYTRVDILADSERERPKAGNNAAVATFSGGVDSSYSVWRYRDGPAGRFRHALRTGVVFHGFDIQRRHKETFVRAFDKAKTMLDSLGMEAVPMEINLRGLGDMGWAHGAVIASCLILLAGGYDAGLIANSVPYYYMTFPGGLPWGSNLLTDEMLSSDSFRIFNDGSGLSRIEKIRELASWPEALQNLRVCHQIGGDPRLRDRNCCRCVKCIRNILGFRALGLGLPPCFEEDVSDSQILRLHYLSIYRVVYFEQVIKQAEASGVTGSWTRALKASMLWNQMKIKASRIPQFRRARRRLQDG